MAEKLVDLRDRLNWQQACTVLGCGKTKFYSLVHAGELTVHRVGKKGLWVSRIECENLLKNSQKNIDIN